jgi:sulfonate transport system permease protein
MKLLHRGLPLILPLVTLLVWELLSRNRILNPVIVPPPSRIAEAFFAMAHNGQLVRNISASLFRVIVGFSLGSFLGLSFGALIGLFPPLERITAFMVSILRPIPMIALVPIFILIFGIDEESKIAIITAGSFWPMFMNTVYGIKGVDRRLLELARVLRKSRFETLARVVFPAALPSLFVGFRLGASAAWVCVVAAEMIAAASGIGYMVMFAREMAQSSVMYMGVLVIGLFGLLIDTVLVRL